MSSSQGRNHWGVGGSGPHQLLLGPLQLFGQLFSWGSNLGGVRGFMIDNQFTYSLVSKLVGLDPVVRGLFPQVEQLVRLLLTIPCSSAEAERSFSGLRRLKTYLRNSMGHARLNHLAILHVHQAMTDGIDLVAVARDFISKCDSRLTTLIGQ